MCGFKKLLKIFYYGSILFILIIFATGCASVQKRSGIPSYNIHGTSYLPLIALCDLKGINWDYDTITRIVSLSKDSHSIKLQIGGNLVIVDGSPRHLNNPIDTYEGAVVVPYKFSQTILDVLFKENIASLEVIKPQTVIRKIIIDAGHGGRDPGAPGRTGLKEKTVNLDIAQRLKSLLESGGTEVVMTRSQDRFVSLEERVRITNSANADLFLSIHANANRVRSLKGFEVYYISSDISDSKRALYAAKNEKLNLDSGCFDSSSLSLKAILWDMVYNYDRAESIELSKAICKNVGCNLNTRVIGVKSANYQVLRGASIPAVLIEVGFLSNADEESLLRDDSYRNKIAKSIAEGLKEYAFEVAWLKQGQNDSFKFSKSKR
jgi:N-acetylmuramoyl-L-alanine amidase